MASKKNSLKKRMPRQILTLVLAVCMLFNVPLPIMATMTSGNGVITMISEFETLQDEIQNRNVPIDTALDKLNLPSTLNATTLDHSKVEDNVLLLPTNATEIKNITIKGITWNSNPHYKADTTGIYIFTAVLPDGYIVEKDVNLPKIIITVAKNEPSRVEKIVVMIDELPTMDEWMAMNESAARIVMDNILKVQAAYELLEKEEKALIDDLHTAKLTELAELARGVALAMPMTIIAGVFGTCSWEIDGLGKLRIFPTNGTEGQLADFNNNAPWAVHKLKIMSVVVEEGVKSNKLLKGMFQSLQNCKSIDLSGFDTSEAINMSGMFSGGRALTKIEFGEKFNTANVTSLSSMFDMCLMLTSIDLSRFDTTKVTDMYAVFANCSKLTSLNVSNFNTKLVTNMGTMFANCGELTSLDVSNFDTSLVTNMNFMFGNSGKLISLDLSNFDTSLVTNLSSMFINCGELTSLNLSNFNTESVTIMTNMFNGCRKLTSIDLSNFNTSKVIDMRDMFRDCAALISLDLSNFETALVKDMNSMFAGCSKLLLLDVSNFNTSKVTTMSAMFRDCSALEKIILSEAFDTTSVTMMSYMFSGCGNLTSLDVSSFNTAKVATMANMFSYCSELLSLDASSFDTTMVTDMRSMFSGCGKLTSLDVSSFNTSKVTTMTNMFSYCTKLLLLDVSKFDTTMVTDMSYMFTNCASLESLDVSNFNTAKVVNMGAMFSGCSKLLLLDLSKFDTTLTSTMSGMFSGCKALHTIHFGTTFNTKNTTNLSNMFYLCNELTSLDLSNFDTTKVSNMSYMFAGCKALRTLRLGTTFNTKNTTNLSNMFYLCNELTSLDLSNFETTKVTNMLNMFAGCTMLTSLDLSKFTFNAVISYNMVGMFTDCNLALNTKFYKKIMSGTKIYLYNMYSEKDFDALSTDLTGNETNIIYKPEVIILSENDNGSVSTTSRFGATDYMAYFKNTALLYPDGEVPPIYKDNQDYAQRGEEVTVTAEPNKGYAWGTVEAKNTEDGTSITLLENKFIMPNGSVTLLGTFLEKKELKDEQITMDITSWTYGGIESVPTGSITERDMNGVYTYVYSSDGGSTWLTRDQLPRSNSEAINAGTYIVKMNYEGDAFIGSKTAMITVAMKSVTVVNGSLAIIPKPYDGTTAVNFTGALALNGAHVFDLVEIDYTGSYASKDVGNNIAVTVTDFSIKGNDAVNYKLVENLSLIMHGSIIKAPGKNNPQYEAALQELEKVHIITNLTPTLAKVTLPKNWSFTGDKNARITAKKENGGKQNFAVQYTSADPNYNDVPLIGNDASFPVTTISMEVTRGLSLISISKGNRSDLGEVTVLIEGAQLPMTGDYAESKIELRSAHEKIARISGAIGGGSVNVDGVTKGLTMVGIAYKARTELLGYILIQVSDHEDSSNSNIADIKDISDTLAILVNPENVSAEDMKAVNMIVEEIVKLPDNVKKDLSKEDVEPLDELKKVVNNGLNIIIDSSIKEGAPPQPEAVSVVGAAIASGITDGEVKVYVTPVATTGDNTKLQIDLKMDVGNTKTQLNAPLFFSMEMPENIDISNLTINHIMDNGNEEVEFTVTGRIVSFKLNSFSGLQFSVSEKVETGGSGSVEEGSNETIIKKKNTEGDSLNILVDDKTVVAPDDKIDSGNTPDVPKNPDDEVAKNSFCLIDFLTNGHTNLGCWGCSIAFIAALIAICGGIIYKAKRRKKNS